MSLCLPVCHVSQTLISILTSLKKKKKEEMGVTQAVNLCFSSLCDSSEEANAVTDSSNMSLWSFGVFCSCLSWLSLYRVSFSFLARVIELFSFRLVFVVLPCFLFRNELFTGFAAFDFYVFGISLFYKYFFCSRHLPKSAFVELHFRLVCVRTVSPSHALV